VVAPPLPPRSDTSTGAFVPGNGGSLDKCRRRWDLADAGGWVAGWLGETWRVVLLGASGWDLAYAGRGWMCAECCGAGHNKSEC